MASPCRWFAGQSMPNARMLVMALALGGIAVACADNTSPLAPPAEQLAPALPSLTWQGVDGPRSATLVGTDILLPSGTRIAIDSATAKNFRRLAVSVPKMEALAQRMAPVWAKMGLPAPTSELQARAALATFRSHAASTAALDGVLALTTPIKGPTMIAECDPVWQFCGFDTGDDPQGGGGQGGSGGQGGQGGNGMCERLGLQLYQAIGQWRQAQATYNLTWNEQVACMREYGLTSPVMCAMELSRLLMAFSQLNAATNDMDSIAQQMRSASCT